MPVERIDSADRDFDRQHAMHVRVSRLLHIEDIERFGSAYLLYLSKNASSKHACVLGADSRRAMLLRMSRALARLAATSSRV